MGNPSAFTRERIVLMMSRRSPSELTTPVAISVELQALLGVKQEMMPRTEVVQRLWKHVRENQLQDPNNKHNFTPDHRMKPIFGTRLVRGFGMAKYLKDHI